MMLSGNSIGVFTNGQLPNIKGILNPGDRRFNTSNVTGCFYSATAEANKYTNQVTTTTTQVVGLNASRSSSIYNDNTSIVIPSSINMYYIIRY